MDDRVYMDPRIMERIKNDLTHDWNIEVGFSNATESFDSCSEEQRIERYATALDFYRRRISFDPNDTEYDTTRSVMCYRLHHELYTDIATRYPDIKPSIITLYFSMQM